MTDFENTQSVRIYRTYDGWNDLSVKARVLFLLVAQNFDHEGFLPKGVLVASAMALGELSAISELVQGGFIVVSSRTPMYRCPWWKASQTAKMSGKLRARNHKSRRAAEKRRIQEEDYLK